MNTCRCTTFFFTYFDTRRMNQKM